MRGSESLTASRPYTGPAKPQSQPQPHPAPFKNSAHKDRATSSNHMDMSALSGHALVKHKRLSSTPKSDAYAPYKRFIQYDTLKDNSRADAVSRPARAKSLKPRLEKTTSEAKTSSYASTTSSGKLPKRSKMSRTENSSRTNDANSSQGEAGRPPLGGRSTTFIVESQNGSVDSRSLETLHRKIKSRHMARSNVTSSTRAHPSSHARPGDHDFHDRPERTATPQEVTSSVESQSEERTERGGRRTRQWQAEECVREGARNPLMEGSVPARPKSAGQLRYCDSEDTDESSLDGEIEIVDIDKELENDPEPSPYWSHGPPLPVPEVFIQTNHSADSLLQPWPPHHHHPYPHSGDGRQDRPVPGGAPHPPPPQYLSSSPPSSLSLLQQQHKSSRGARQRHGSGESDLSAFSDTVLKPSAPGPHERRRFLSEPEILGVGEEGARSSNARATKGGRLSDDSRADVNDATFPPSGTTTVVPRGRERLYSDAMERVLSRYTAEMALRDVSSKGKASRLTGGQHHLPLPPSSPHVPGGVSGVRDTVSGHSVPPPRKLKPILKPPKSEADHSPAS
ncbi:uncharacterized protein LOC143291424 [Babylonia areolata]|uniref:uncharacterized protein LOC143291424 n=1 Tax=Babylonia areolata TaxID=304850 RepID=UPI003FCFD05F